MFFVVDHLQATSKLEDQENAAESMSSFPEVKRYKSSNRLEEVLPANRSSLNPFKKIQESIWVSSVDSLHGKSLQNLGSKSLHPDSKIIDLADNTLLDQNSSKQTLTPCSLRKRKLPSYLEKGKMLSSGNNHQDPIAVKYVQSEKHVSVKSVEHEDDSWSRKDDQVGSVNMSGNDGHVQKIESNILDQKDEVIQLSQEPLDNYEAQGSSFLIQVWQLINSGNWKAVALFHPIY